jgi:hypothetical protein
MFVFVYIFPFLCMIHIHPFYDDRSLVRPPVVLAEAEDAGVIDAAVRVKVADGTALRVVAGI